jgi:hypothetical protein
MGKIYALAKEVVVWLGPEKDGSKVAIEFIKHSASSDVLPGVDGISLSPQKAKLDATMELGLFKNYFRLERSPFTVGKIYYAGLILPSSSDACNMKSSN